ncbi:unnamed protein product [Taenia asiatica]|uniref:TPR_REGION domain-containing protein n=1 Tax=Taenia asiatica TaxID=60517 RepID=A0A0R3VXR8_TAEAS|nr:unnamed protein product [Taenia asiatica]
MPLLVRLVVVLKQVPDSGEHYTMNYQKWSEPKNVFIFCFRFLPYRQTGDLHGEAKACANLSTCFKMIEKFSEAVLCAKRQLEICRRFNDEAAIARALHNLGNAYHAKGRQFLQFSGTDQLGEFTSEAKQDQERALAYFQ